MCCEIFELDAAIFLAAPGLARQAALKKTKVELALFTGIYVLLVVEKGIRGRMCHAIDWYAKANNSYMKSYDKIKQLPYIKHLDVYNLSRRAMSQKLSVNGFKCVEDVSEFNEGFIKSCNENSKEWCFLEVDVEYPKKLHEHHNDLLFSPERIKTIENYEKLRKNYGKC